MAEFHTSLLLFVLLHNLFDLYALFWGATREWNASAVNSFYLIIGKAERRSFAGTKRKNGHVQH